MMLTCRTYSGAECEAIGLASQCFPDEGFHEAVEAFARTILANSWFSHRANKRLLMETDGLPLEALEGLASEAENSISAAP